MLPPYIHFQLNRYQNPNPWAIYPLRPRTPMLGFRWHLAIDFPIKQKPKIPSTVEVEKSLGAENQHKLFIFVRYCSLWLIDQDNHFLVEKWTFMPEIWILKGRMEILEIFILWEMAIEYTDTCTTNDCDKWRFSWLIPENITAFVLWTGICGGKG